MSSNPEKSFGFELLFNISGVQITKKEDVLILFVHWYFIKNKFKCLGIGDSKIIEPTETGSELLPNGWNQSLNYSLRYVKEGKLYILIGVKSETDLMINLLRIEDHSVSNAQFSIDNVKQLQGPLEIMIPNYEGLLNILKQDLIKPLNSQTQCEVSTQTSQSGTERSGRDDDPLRVESQHRPAGSNIPGLRRNDPSRIGKDDLDPFGVSGGGMLFDPFANRGLRLPHPGLGIPGRLPQGSVPSGSRFDPFGPPDIENPNPRARLPDADHLFPPGFDDMFM
ncbi:PREDICTED: proteasome inhibitor PI31 subunit [Ceratosolen solmsi marchali]|uniref:Proteasome inhibitor PI31 subunit n=1 Tax=Ceratosolen solmsi marchali TaxID=326594 RepID=A0AAJ6YW99_9HYME|nr:PREDICTED: proteasome inhibitor PI31 subunit [Ceratosolen solmsi marchali]